MAENKIPYKIYLEESEMPKAWYNLRADMINKPAPLLDPSTGEPITPEALSHVFCDELVKQELDDTSPYFEIPTEIRDFYKMYRPALSSAPIALRKSSRLLRRFTTSSRVTTPPAVIS